ncbi:hypothetical protein SLE2022_310410 [Rubroshorea leprosula]
MNSNFKINGGTEYGDKGSTKASDEDTDQPSCDIDFEQTQCDEEDDDMAIELRVPETDLEDEARGIDTMARLSVDSSAKRSVNHQNKHKGLAEGIEEEAFVTGEPDECFQKANELTTGGLEGSTRKHLMIAGLEEERSEMGA